MDKIIKSAFIVLAVAAVAGYGTYSFFNDTETSSGNTFTAGSLDLIFKDVTGSSNNPITGPLFTLPDMKPGDSGEKTVNLAVDNNPACGKFSINVTEDKDNTCTEPEGIDEGGTAPGCTLGGTEGELNDAIKFMIWKDNGHTGTNGQGVCDNQMNYGETVLVSGPLTGNVDYSLGDLPTSTADCYGISYCFGNLKADGTCDGSIVNNASQTDSFKADIIIEALQKKNQQFPNQPVSGVCPPAGNWPTQPVI
jgi:predicted ribosomally synthesized peptide with SipW-like signal peptide